jgi:Obg family GTPase CgtA-like protein
LNKADAVPAAVIEEQRARFVTEAERLRGSGHPAFSYLVEGELPPVERLVWPVSAVTGAGLNALLHWVGPALRQMLAAAQPGLAPGARLATTASTGVGRADPERTRPTVDAGGHATYRPLESAPGTFAVYREGSVFKVRGRAVHGLVRRFDLTNEEAIRYLGERLDRLGVYASLRACGAQPGDDVDIEGYAFEFH